MKILGGVVVFFHGYSCSPQQNFRKIAEYKEFWVNSGVKINPATPPRGFFKGKNEDLWEIFLLKNLGLKYGNFKRFLFPPWMISMGFFLGVKSTKIKKKNAGWNAEWKFWFFFKTPFGKFSFVSEKKKKIYLHIIQLNEH